MNHPKEAKFKMIKKNNHVIKEKLLNLKGGIHDLILDLGFNDVNFIRII